MQGLPAVAQRRGVQVHLPAGFDAGRHVGEAEVDRLMLDQRLAHALALARVREGGFERGARNAGRLRGDVDAAGLEVRQRDPIALAFLAEQMLSLAVLENDLRGVGRVLAGLLLDPGHRVAGRRGGHDEGADATFLPALLSVTAKDDGEVRRSCPR